MKELGVVSFVLSILALLWFVLVVPIVGWHMETSKGEHTGYITATETSGIFFKTHTAYIKTDTQSSQEESYCVVDEEVFAKLKKLTESKELVTIKYIDWFSKGVASCNGEMGGVIVGVN